MVGKEPESRRSGRPGRLKNLMVDGTALLALAGPAVSAPQAANIDHAGPATGIINTVPRMPSPFQEVVPHHDSNPRLVVSVRMPKGGSLSGLAKESLQEADLPTTTSDVNRLANVYAGLNPAIPNLDNIQTDAPVNIFTHDATREITAIATTTHLPFDATRILRIRDGLIKTNEHEAGKDIEDVRAADNELAKTIVAAGPDLLAAYEPASQSEIDSYATYTVAQALSDYEDTWNTGVQNPDGFDEIGRSPGKEGTSDYTFSRNGVNLAITVSDTDTQINDALAIPGYPQRFRALLQVATQVKSIRITPDADKQLTYVLRPQTASEGTTKWEIQEEGTTSFDMAQPPSTQKPKITPTELDQGTFAYIKARTG